ncbi:MAG: class I SAM-dependent methyltransferase [Rhodospirillales bacterium]|nr:class I SAM-dependent methyltransferase [Rhodospirillales bacterium]
MGDRQFFETSFGRRIAIDPDFRASHRIVTETDLSYDYEQQPASPYEFSKDLYEFLVFFEFLNRQGMRFNWQRSLDIGGAESTIARLTKASGLARDVACLDVRDARAGMSDSHFAQYMEYTRQERDRLRQGAPLASLPLLKFFPSFAAEFGTHILNGQGLQALTCQPATLDTYYCGDIYNLNRSFDLITAFLCLSHFDLDALMAKVSDLLEVGGFFFFFTDYWWWPVNSAEVVGDFPYACQRLTEADLERYFAEFRPEEREQAMRRYRYFHHDKAHPTARDYIDAARRAGLEPVASERLMPKPRSHLRTPFAPTFFDLCGEDVLGGVLEDIHQFRPDVELQDLRTAYVLHAFHKPARPHDTLKGLVQGYRATADVQRKE